MYASCSIWGRIWLLLHIIATKRNPVSSPHRVMKSEKTTADHHHHHHSGIDDNWDLWLWLLNEVKCQCVCAEVTDDASVCVYSSFSTTTNQKKNSLCLWVCVCVCSTPVRFRASLRDSPIIHVYSIKPSHSY